MADDKSKAQKAVEKDEEGVAEAANAEVQSIVDEETKRGFRGEETAVDPTPNENYTVAGVTSGAPTPETDHEQALKAQQSGLTKFNNKGQQDS